MEFFRRTTGVEQLSSANTAKFNFDKWVSRIRTMTIVKVIAVEVKDGFGTVDVIPLINRIDFDGHAEEMSPIYNIPFIRLQGSANSGIILNPEIGDIGLAIVSDRDITSIVSVRDRANPLSNRSYSLSDSIYLGGILNQEPTQFVEFNNSGIKISSPKAISLSAPSVNITASEISIVGETSIDGNLMVTGNISSAMDVSDSVGKMSDFRSDYSHHSHNVAGVESGNSTITTSGPNK